MARSPARPAAFFAASVAAFLAAPVALVPLAGPARADADASARIAIIDTAWDTRPFLEELRASGVLVVARYMARCPQPERHIPEKRLIDQGAARDPSSEVSRILAAGMGILSIYQYNNDSKNKFLGRDRDGTPLPDAACRRTGRPRAPAEEAELDADAALAQARALGQPAGSAIYFGVDIAFDRRDAATRGAMLTYFRHVRSRLSRAGYALGAYGNGDALAVLNEAGLIDHAWLSASRAYPGTTAFHNSGAWHLFQNGVNLEWFAGTPPACRAGLPLDTNVKNARHADRPLGIWTHAGPVRIDPARTRAIHAARRFACDGDARLRRTATSGPGDLVGGRAQCRGRRAVPHPTALGYANSARLGRRAGAVVEVDHDEDGSFDGWTALANLTASFDEKPAWIASRNRRAGARCR